MAKKHVLKAEPRQRTGSGVLKQMRREGWVPSVIYGRGSENKNLKVDAKAFDELLAHATSENILINLDLGGTNQLAFLSVNLIFDHLQGPCSQLPGDLFMNNMMTGRSIITG